MMINIQVIKRALATGNAALVRHTVTQSVPGAVATVWTVCLFRKLWDHLQCELQVNVPLFL